MNFVYMGLSDTVSGLVSFWESVVSFFSVIWSLIVSTFESIGLVFELAITQLSHIQSVQYFDALPNIVLIGLQFVVCIGVLKLIFSLGTYQE